MSSMALESFRFFWPFYAYYRPPPERMDEDEWGERRDSSPRPFSRRSATRNYGRQAGPQPDALRADLFYYASRA